MARSAFVEEASYERSAFELCPRSPTPGFGADAGQTMQGRAHLSKRVVLVLAIAVFLQRGQIVTVHGDDVIEALEV